MTPWVCSRTSRSVTTTITSIANPATSRAAQESDMDDTHMNGLTPDAMARLASRIYNEVSGLDSVGMHNGEAAHAVAPPASPETAEGARLFLERIRATVPTSSVGLISDTPELEGIRRAITNGETTATYASRPVDVAALRRDFPVLQQRVHGRPLAWLDNAATTQKPQSVIDALSGFYAQDNSNIHRAAHTLAARAT